MAELTRRRLSSSSASGLTPGPKPAQGSALAESPPAHRECGAQDPTHRVSGAPQSSLRSQSRWQHEASPHGLPMPSRSHCPRQPGTHGGGAPAASHFSCRISILYNCCVFETTSIDSCFFGLFHVIRFFPSARRDSCMLPESLQKPFFR